MRISTWRKTGKRIYTAYALLTTLMLILGACATVEKDMVAVPDEPSVDRTPTVVALADGREGFMISEHSAMDEKSREDFDHAVTLLNNGDYGQAIELLESIVQRSPSVTAPYIDLAIAYRRTGKPEQAEEHLKTALALVPEHPVACNEYGLLYRMTGSFAEARAIYEKALARFPNYYPVHKNLGILCDLYLDDTECALSHYEIYSEGRPEDKQVQLWIADLRARSTND